MNSAVDVVAAFNPMGEIKPIYVRLEDENHTLQIYKISEIRNKKAEKYSGINAFLFVCSIICNNCQKEIRLRFYCDSHKWVLVHL
ncbi:MAG: PBECR2 domain-containing protein [Lachnoclostridium sp.]|jgi:hypothetical protein